MRKTPYQMLLNDVREFCRKLQARHNRALSYCDKERLIADDRWCLRDIYEKTFAAQDLGYEVHLVANEKGLHFKYVENVPDIPWKWK